MRLVLHFARFGPYHHARLRAVVEELAPLGWEVIGLQTASTDGTYEWREEDPMEGGAERAPVVTVFPGRVYDEIPSEECRLGLVAFLDELAPDVVAVPGWGTIDARVSLSWCRRNRAKAVIMSETREVDGERKWWKERIKTLIMRHVHGALVGGAAHRDYLVKLGIPATRIVTGYNVVDNAYFAAEAARWRLVDGPPSDACAKVGPYFLASNRFIPRKNLERLIDAYAQFRAQTSAVPWSLCLLGDGPLRASFVSRCHALGLKVMESAPWESSAADAPGGGPADGMAPTVYFPGFRQIEELPRFYASAGAMIHPALEEPWGLVINEAMACGLPILSGNNVGAAAELVREGYNGWTFDAGNVGAMAEAMERIAALPEADRLAMGQVGAAYLEDRYPTRAFASGLGKLIL